ncbi:MAG: PAS domain-containing protein, partial [Candidatus Aminicenantales bacterium]
EAELATIAELKSLQVSAWRLAHLAVARNMSESRFFPAQTELLIKNPASAKVRRNIYDGIDHLRLNFPEEYVRGGIVLTGGKVLLSYPEKTLYTLTQESVRVSQEAWQTRKVVFGDLSRDPGSGRISIPVAFPIMVPKDAGPEPIAVMAFEIDPGPSLYPLLRPWPSASPTSEILLIRREGKDFVYLSEPRYKKDVALNLRLPIARFRRASPDSPIGEDGVIEGKDYRGENVLGFIKSVPDSPWLVEAKVDASEFSAGWSRWTGLISIAIIMFVLAAGLSLSLFWKRQKALVDADEQERWERALRNQNEFLRVMIDVMPNAAFLKDTEGQITGCNAAFEKLLNLSKSQILGRPFSALTSKELADKDRDADQVLRERAGVQVYEAPLKSWDGSEHHIIFIKSSYARPDGKTGGQIGTMIDITQRKRAEEELQQIKKFSDGIVQTMTEGLVLTDSEGRFSFLNPAAAAILGYAPGEMVDKEVISFIPNDQHPVVRRADERRARGIADRNELDFL